MQRRLVYKLVPTYISQGGLLSFVLLVLPQITYCFSRNSDLGLLTRWRELELELELIQSHMTQKPMLRGEVDARAPES